MQIQNMVCPSCRVLLRERLVAAHLPIEEVELGRASFDRDLDPKEVAEVDRILAELGFARLQSRRSIMLERVKTLAREWVEGGFRRSPFTFSVHLAEAMDMDYSYLTHLFSQEMGQTLEQHLILLRTERARDLLRDDTLSSTEVAEKLGYSSLAHFSSQFKKTTGLSPTEYRQSVAEGE